jgi:hypothetical protein
MIFFQAFKHSNDIYDRHIRTFDEQLKEQLRGYLLHEDLVDDSLCFQSTKMGLAQMPFPGAFLNFWTQQLILWRENCSPASMKMG